MAMSYFVRLIGRIIKWVLIVGVGLGVIVGVVGFFLIRSLILPETDKFGTVQDEAMRAGMTVDQFNGAPEPYLAEMDHGLLLKEGPDFAPEVLQVAADLDLDPEEVRQRAIRGQNMWTIWTGGNDRFWDWFANNAFGTFDLLKIISSHPEMPYGRHNRFRYLGAVNEPCYEQASAAGEYGLWLDVRTDECGDDPFANAETYPGAKLGARGENVEVGSHYGAPTGVMGLRLFPNPDFDAEAEANWDADRYYTDPTYYKDKDLVRPYRVGMSCGFCHVGPNPLKPPANIEEPTYAELSSNVGAQYYWVDRIFYWHSEPRQEETSPAPNENDFIFQWIHSQPMGTLDTSLVSSDYMNNPRTMNAVYETRARLMQSVKTAIETLDGGERDNTQFQDFEATEKLAPLYDPATGHVASMRVLKDGADSVGALGALNRVYLNIGLFSEEWLLHFRPLIGGRMFTPIEIEVAQKNSVYWQATEKNTVDMAIFFLVTTRADKLADAEAGPAILALDEDKVDRGMEVFAENCAACHSDVNHQPEPDPSFGVDQGICEGGGAGPDYLECWDRYWKWASSDGFKEGMKELVKDPDFLVGNYLSTERRVPMDFLGVNACSPTATNGLDGDIWDNFSSDTYKQLPAVGPVTIEHPVSGGESSFQALGNGRGYLRPASLVSLWTSAPYMLNNSVGYERHYYSDDFYGPVEAAAPAATDAGATDAGTGSEGTETAEGTEETAPAAVEAPNYNYAYAFDKAPDASCPSADPNNPYMPCTENRVAMFETSIRKMLSPDTRRKDTVTQSPVPGYMYRTSAPSCLKIAPGYAPDFVQNWSGTLNWLAPWAITPEGGIEVGPFPEDFPVNALMNTQILPDNDGGPIRSHLWKLAKAGPNLLGTFKELGGQCSREELDDATVMATAAEIWDERKTIDTLVGLSKCPDYVVNKGHEFGHDLSDADKDALIAYLKRF